MRRIFMAMIASFAALISGCRSNITVYSNEPARAWVYWFADGKRWPAEAQMVDLGEPVKFKHPGLMGFGVAVLRRQGDAGVDELAWKDVGYSSDVFFSSADWQELTPLTHKALYGELTTGMTPQQVMLALGPPWQFSDEHSSWSNGAVSINRLDYDAGRNLTTVTYSNGLSSSRYTTKKYY